MSTANSSRGSFTRRLIGVETQHEPCVVGHATFGDISSGCGCEMATSMQCLRTLVEKVWAFLPPDVPCLHETQASTGRKESSSSLSPLTRSQLRPGNPKPPGVEPQMLARALSLTSPCLSNNSTSRAVPCSGGNPTCIPSAFPRSPRTNDVGISNPTLLVTLFRVLSHCHVGWQSLRRLRWKQ